MTNFLQGNELLITFIVLNILNVIIQTVKTLCTVKGNKGVAAIANAIAFGFYTIVIVYMVCDLPLLQKVIVVALCNLIGVYAVKSFEEKMKKDKLWKVETTFPSKSNWKEFMELLKQCEISCNYIDIGKYTLVNCYCETQKESSIVYDLLKNKFPDAKFFVSETKNLY